MGLGRRRILYRLNMDPSRAPPTSAKPLRRLATPDQAEQTTVSTTTSSGRVPLFLTPGEVAEVLRTSRKAIYGLIERKALPGVVRVGRRVLVRRTTLLDSLREKEVSSPEERR